MVTSSCLQCDLYIPDPCIYQNANAAENRFNTHLKTVYLFITIFRRSHIHAACLLESFLTLYTCKETPNTLLQNANFYVLLTVHISISLDNDQLDAHLLYFTIRPLQSSTCFEHYMLIIRRLNCIDEASGIVTLSKWPSGAQVERERVLSQPVHRTATD